MKNGLAIWLYPHRSVLENVAYFADCGFESVSILGSQMFNICTDEEAAKALAELVREKDLILTVHHKLPYDHLEETVSEFKNHIDVIAQWQKEYGAMSILSFDVPQMIRDDITSYIDYVLETVGGCKIAVEDFGLNEAERLQIEHLKGNPRFGYLLDIGHMYMRICGKNKSEKTLFNNSPEECPVCEQPAAAEFLAAFRSKEFPIFEIHLHNNNGKEDLHYFLEDGTLEIQAIADVLKTIGYDGVLTIESAPSYQVECAYPEADVRIKETYSYWKKLINA